MQFFSINTISAGIFSNSSGRVLRKWLRHLLTLKKVPPARASSENRDITR
jgi:hypothetical protein